MNPSLKIKTILCDNSIVVSLLFFSPHPGARGGPNVVLGDVSNVNTMAPSMLPTTGCHHCFYTPGKPLHRSVRKTAICGDPGSFARISRCRQVEVEGAQLVRTSSEMREVLVW